jgi:hypothetical protein
MALQLWKLPLVLLLIGMQVLSWGPAPLFLCLSSHAAISFDFGPDECHCQKHSHEETDGCVAGRGACGQHGCCGDHEDCEGQAPAVTDDPCDCTHIQLSRGQIPATVGSKAFVTIDHALAGLVATFDAPVQYLAHLWLNDLPPNDLGARDAPSTLAALSSVILRC